MKALIYMIVIYNFMIISNYAYCSDSDGNGIDDAYESGLVEKFMPCIQLDSNDNGVSPEPIEIIGAQTINNMYVRVW